MLLNASIRDLYIHDRSWDRSLKEGITWVNASFRHFVQLQYHCDVGTTSNGQVSLLRLEECVSLIFLLIFLAFFFVCVRILIAQVVYLRLEQFLTGWRR
jgi:hypothetical protein